MNSFARLPSVFLLVAVMAGGLVAAPVLPGVSGVSGKHPLSPAQVGDLLISELRCTACHDAGPNRFNLEKAAPDLAEAGARLAPDFMERFIASPSSVHAGTTMPDLLHGEAQEKRAEIAKAITHFLVAQSPRSFKATAANADDAKAGKELFHTVGCVACHAPRDEQDRETLLEGSKSLAQVAGKYSVESLSEFLFQPGKVRPSGRMPDMKLTRPEARIIASYLLGSGGALASALEPQEALVVQGRKYFEQYNCSACHKVGDMAAAPVVGSLATMDVSRGCLSAEANKSPRFHLSKEQVEAIKASMAAKGGAISDKARIDMTLMAFNCVACHVRDEHGGVSEERNEWFKTTEQNLGDDARIPPQLTLVGAKLQALWMKKVLFDGETARPYMLTRMPQFGEANLRHLPDLFGRVDSIKTIEFPEPVKDRERELRKAGHQLLGDKGLNCVTCHTFNGKASQGFKGIDLMTSQERLKPSWFYHFMRDPAAYRPRIVMPTYWPDGKAVLTDVLHGETDSQIQAIWYFMSLGTSAQDPSGLRSVDSKLQVTDTTRTYRGRSSIAGYRGIAVGFPGGLSYAFNAETGTLSGLWRGEFISVGRGGQGSGNFNPAGRAVALAQDVSFFDLPDEKAPWPLRPTMTKEAPVNPDPLYPRNRGYQFKGYQFDAQSIPTFFYHTGDIRIEDRSEPASSAEKPTLVRVMKMTSPQARTIWFRAMTGRIDAVSKVQFRTADWQLTGPSVPTLLRPMGADPNVMELLFKLEIPKGESTVTLTYELLKP